MRLLFLQQRQERGQIKFLLESEAASHLSKAAYERLRWIVCYFGEGLSISETCQRFGISRSTFHRWLNRFDPEHLSSLEEKQNEEVGIRIIPQETIALIRAYRTTSPTMGKEKIRELLKTQHSITLSSSTVGRVIEKHGLYLGSTPLHRRKQMQSQKGEIRSENLSPRNRWPEISAPIRNTKYGMRNTKLQRTLVTFSVLANLAIASLFALTLWWESDAQEVSIQATVSENISSNPKTHYVPSSLDLP